MFRIASILILTLVLATPAQAGLKEGVDAYDRGDYATALREWRPLAEQGAAVQTKASNLLSADFAGA